VPSRLQCRRSLGMAALCWGDWWGAAPLGMWQQQQRRRLQVQQGGQGDGRRGGWGCRHPLAVEGAWRRHLAGMCQG
jgi:hypothetical protein